MLPLPPVKKAFMLHSMVTSPRPGDQPARQCNSEISVATILLVAPPGLGDQTAGQCTPKTLMTSFWTHTEQESPGREQGTAQLPKPCSLGGEELHHLLSTVVFSCKSAARLWVARPRAKSPVLSES